MPCSVARALDVVGDWWTLLIVRDAFLGVHRFADFRDNLGIARNILAGRLRKLVDEGILVKRDVGGKPGRQDYHLTDKGRDLWLVLTALRLWGDKWIHGEGKEPLVVEESDSGAVVARLLAVDAEGTALDPRKLVAKAGPGATPESVARYRELSGSQSRRD